MSFEIQFYLTRSRNVGNSISILFSNVKKNATFLIKLTTGGIVGMNLLFRDLFEQKSSLEPISEEFLFGVPLAQWPNSWNYVMKAHRRLKNTIVLHDQKKKKVLAQ